MEFRRLLPRLEEKVETYALDLLGGGFTTNKGEVTVEAKRTQIKEFLDFVGKEVVLVGASLGGASAVDYAASLLPEERPTLALVAPQVTIDGAPELPPFFAQLGVQVLKSYPLRWVANQMAYADPGTFATEEAIAIGRLHTKRNDWDALQIAWLQTGGYTTISQDFKTVGSSDLHLFWGRQDNILPPDAATLDLLTSAAPRAPIVFYDDCGHVPHLEQPTAFANDLADLILTTTKKSPR